MDIQLREKIVALCNKGNVIIPKPKSSNFYIHGISYCRGCEALVYKVPSHKDKSYYLKNITLNEFKIAFDHLKENNTFTRKWFNINMPECAKNGPCNFTTIGGIFVLLNIAIYNKPGEYIMKVNS